MPDYLTDKEFLDDLPDGWFYAEDLHQLQPGLRCIDLERKGKLKSRLVTVPRIQKQFKKKPQNEESAD